MTGILLSKGFVATYGKLLNESTQRAGFTLDIVHLPDEPQSVDAVGEAERAGWALSQHADPHRRHARVAILVRSAKLAIEQSEGESARAAHPAIFV